MMRFALAIAVLVGAGLSVPAHGQYRSPELAELHSENRLHRTRAIRHFCRQSSPSEEVVSALAGLLSKKNLSHSDWREIARCVAKNGGRSSKSAILRSLDHEWGELYAGYLSQSVPSYDAEFDAAMRESFRTSSEVGRECIAQLYAKWGDKGVDGLRALLRSGKDGREILLKSLGSSGSRRAIPVLQAYLADSPWTVARALVAIGPPASGVLRSATSRGGEFTTRAACAWGYGQVSGPEGVAHLRELVFDLDPHVASYALLGLGYTSSDAANQLLLEHFPETEGTARKFVVDSLGRLGRKESIPILRQAMDDPDAMVRDAAVWALKKVDGPVATDCIVEGLADASPKVAASAAWCAGHLAAGQAVPSLVRLVEESTDKYTLRAVAFALSSITQHDRSTPELQGKCRQALLILSKHEWAEIRTHAARGLKHTE